MDPEARAALARTTRALRQRLVRDVAAAARGLGAAQVEAASYAWLRREVLRRVLEATCGPLAREGAAQGLLGALSLDGPAIVPAATARAAAEALDAPALAEAWRRATTLGWVHQAWNDPERESLDDKLLAGGKLERHEIARKTQLFTERYVAGWLLHNSLLPQWLAICARHGWTPEAEADGTLARLEARRDAWRRARAEGAVPPGEPLALETPAERRWAWYVPQPRPDDAVGHAPPSVRELRILDPAVGAGHLLVEALGLLVALHREEARHRGQDGQPQWSDRAIVEHVLSECLLGIDLDPRAIELAAAALWIEGQRIAPGAAPRRLWLVATGPGCIAGPADAASLVAAGVPRPDAERILRARADAEHLGSLVRADADPALAGALARALDAPPDALSRWLGPHQPSAAARWLQVVQPGTAHLVVANPPYQGTSRLRDAAYVRASYPLGKADLFAAFIERSLELVREGGSVALLTLRSWMYLEQYAGLRAALLERCDLRALVDLGAGAFEGIGGSVVAVAGAVVRRRPPSGAPAIAVRATQAEGAHKHAAVLAQLERHAFDPAALRGVPGWPLVYGWGPQALEAYARCPRVRDVAPVLKGLSTQDNARFLRRPWEVRPGSIFVARTRPSAWPRAAWVPYVKGGEGAAWFEAASTVIRWSSQALELRVWLEHYGEGKPGGFFKHPERYFEPGVAVTAVGSTFAARLHRHASVLGHMGTSAFPSDRAALVCALNGGFARAVAEALNPTVHFGVGDIERIPVVEVADAPAIVAVLEQAFTAHEAHREPSLEYVRPGPSGWRHAQAWAQQAVDRPAGAPLPPYAPQLEPEPATAHVGHALGVALGRFHPGAGGLVDPAVAVSHALPHAILFLDGTLAPHEPGDGLGHPAAAPLHAAWAAHAAAIAPPRSLRDYLRLDFFAAVHRPLYENRPIFLPLSSHARTFVAWVCVHRLEARTLRALVDEHLRPALARLEARAGAPRSVAHARACDELRRFIERVACCAEHGPPPPDAATPAREVDAPYEPELDDGVLVNAAALYPLLASQWKDPARWWKGIASGRGRQACDWARLVARYWPSRVEARCRDEPSLAVAHRCLWRLHPARAHAWELRLRAEHGPASCVDEPDADLHRARFLAEHAALAAELEAQAGSARARRPRAGRVRR